MYSVGAACLDAATRAPEVAHHPGLRGLLRVSEGASACLVMSVRGLLRSRYALTGLLRVSEEASVCLVMSSEGASACLGRRATRAPEVLAACAHR